MLTTLTNLIVVSAVLPLALFVYFYGRYSPWRLTNIGRTMMYKNLAFIAVILLVIASLFLGDYPGRDIIRFVVYTGVVVTFWMNFYNLRKVQTQYSTAKYPQLLDRLNPRNWRNKK